MSKFDLQKYISQSPLLEGTSYTPNSEEDGKMIYKSHLLEGLTKEEADSFSEKYKKRYASILKSNPNFIKKYPNPDAVVHGMVVKEIVKLREKLDSSDPIEKYVDDFQKSDAKQFQNKSKEDIGKMAQAAYFSNTKNEQMENSRLQELVKKALANPISEKVEFTDKHDGDKGLKGKQKDLPDNLQAKILNKEELELTTKQRTTTAQNITGLPSFAQEILDHINKIEKIEGKGYINNGRIQNIIKQLTALVPKNESLAETILKELRGNVNEALNKPLDKFGKDVEKRLNTLGFETKVFGGQSSVPSSAEAQILKNPKLAGMSYTKIKPGEASNTSDRDYEYIEVVVSAQKLNQLKKLKSYFKTADGNYGPDKDLGWIIKNVKKTNPGDIIGSEIKKYGDKAMLSYYTSLPGGEKVKTRNA